MTSTVRIICSFFRARWFVFSVQVNLLNTLNRILNKCRRESKAVSSFDVVKSAIKSTRPEAMAMMIQIDEYEKFVETLHLSSHCVTRYISAYRNGFNEFDK